MDSQRGSHLNQTTSFIRSMHRPGCGNMKNHSTSMDNTSTSPTESSFNDSYQDPCQEEFASIGMTEFILEILGLSAVTVFGTIMNLLVVYLLIKYPKSRSSASLFIMNLTVIDLVSSITIIPMTIYGITRETWTHGHVLCIMSQALLSIPYCVSFWGHLGLAVCRYCLLNFKSKVCKVLLKHSSVIIAIICMWLLQIVVHWTMLWTSSPMAMIRFLPEYGVCGIVTTNDEGYLVMSSTLTVIIMFPFLACIIIYVTIAYQVHRQVNAFPSQQAKHRFLQMSRYTTFLFGIFCLSWLPDYLRLLIDVDGQAPVWLIRLGNFLYYLNCAVNPYIYALRCDPLRKAFVQQFPTLATVFRFKFNQVHPGSLITPPEVLEVNQPASSQNRLFPRSAIPTVSSQVP